MKKKKFIKYFIEYFILILLTAILRLIPLTVNLKWAKIIGRFLFLLNKRHRLRAIDNLYHAFPEKKEEEILKICQDVYINMVKVYMEFLFLPYLNDKYLQMKTRIIGRENLEKALALNKGIVSVTSHLDNWELVGTILVHHGFPVDAIYHPMKNPYSDKFIYNIRKKTGMQLISMNNSLKPSLKALAENHLLGLIADQDAGGDGVFINFFGRPASTAKGPAFFAVKTGAPMLFFTMLRDNNDSHSLYISSSLPVKITGDLKNDIYYNTKLWSDELEKWVRKYPEQWFWLHRRWHSRPKKENRK